MSELSPAAAVVTRLVRALGRENAHRAIDALLEEMSVSDVGALAYDWGFWARPKQLPPATDWRTWGTLAGRGFGKTLACSNYVNGEAEAGRAKLIGLAAQDEANCVAIQIKGPSGLIATAPPWFKPEWHAADMELHWPNGARAFVRTPEVPGKIRGLEYHLAWLTELQSWPVATRDEAFSNFRISTRIGYGRIVWDATPKKKHPILLELLADGELDPERFIVVRGTTHENAMNLGRGYIEDLERKYGGTQKGREELGGEMLDDAEHAIAKQAWIDRARRPRPDKFVRRGIGVDPALTSRKGSDRTGIIEAALGVDGQGYVLADRSGKHDVEAWAGIVLDTYVANGCDVVVVETNKGGDLVARNLRAAAGPRRLNVVVLGKNERPGRVPGVVYVKEVYARGPKEDRAQPISTAYERGRISHVLDADLSSYEETLTTWEPAPGARSPDDLDAATHILSELLDLTESGPDPAAGFRGLAEAGQKLAGGAPVAENVAEALRKGLRGGGQKL